MFALLLSISTTTSNKSNHDSFFFLGFLYLGNCIKHNSSKIAASVQAIDSLLGHCCEFQKIATRVPLQCDHRLELPQNASMMTKGDLVIRVVPFSIWFLSYLQHCKGRETYRANERMEVYFFSRSLFLLRAQFKFLSIERSNL